jgi:hypothetical protein
MPTALKAAPKKRYRASRKKACKTPSAFIPNIPSAARKSLRPRIEILARINHIVMALALFSETPSNMKVTQELAVYVGTENSS